jgi:hypothetical protein
MWSWVERKENSVDANEEDIHLEAVTELIESLTQWTLEETSRGADRYRDRLHRHKECLLQARRRRNIAFQQRLYDRWFDALDLYELGLHVAQHCGAEFNKNFRPLGAATHDFQFEALSRLHGNAALVASEIYQLLLGGFASGAHARWRTLHETAIVMHFIDDQGPETAEAFLLHREVKAFEDAKHYRMHSQRLGIEELPTKEFEKLEHQANELLKRYGKGFGADWGWVASAIQKIDPSHRGAIGIKHLQKAVSSEHWNPYYRMANNAVHATSHSIRFNLGRMIETPLILAGPSNAGLADPGHGALLSLLRATTTLMSCALRMAPGFDHNPNELLGKYRPALSIMAELKTLAKLADEAGTAFLAAHQQLVKEEEEKANGELDGGDAG